MVPNTGAGRAAWLPARFGASKMIWVPGVTAPT